MDSRQIFQHGLNPIIILTILIDYLINKLLFGESEIFTDTC